MTGFLEQALAEVLEKFTELAQLRDGMLTRAELSAKLDVYMELAR